MDNVDVIPSMSFESTKIGETLTSGVEMESFVALVSFSIRRFFRVIFECNHLFFVHFAVNIVIKLISNPGTKTKCVKLRDEPVTFEGSEVTSLPSSDR